MEYAARIGVEAQYGLYAIPINLILIGVAIFIVIGAVFFMSTTTSTTRRIGIVAIILIGIIIYLNPYKLSQEIQTAKDFIGDMVDGIVIRRAHY